jgi:heavy metal translocating P-type ATPase
MRVSTETKVSAIVLDIEGMTCASCVNKVEKALSGVDQVEMAIVNLANRTAIVRTVAPTDVEPLIRAVQHVGYGAHRRSGGRPAGEEMRAYFRRLVVAVAFTIPVLILSFGVPEERWAMWVTCVLATPVVFYAGWPFFRSAARAARHGATTMDTLVALGAAAAYGYSTFVTATGADGHYFDTAALIVTLILVGKTLEARARSSAGDAARTLLDRGAKEATVLADGVERRVPIDDVRPGNVVVVLPGEKIPADGVVKEGTSWVDLSMLTGESVPVDVGPGNEVVGASINGHGRLVVFITKVGANTKLSEIVRLLESAQGSKAPVQRLADRVSAIFVPVVMLIALATFVGWLVIANAEPGQALLHAVAVLLIACPCALGLATPAAIMAGTGRAAELGILFKGGEVFEMARAADIVLLDKTGTVTEGAMRLADVVPLGGFTAEEVLALAAAAESGSEHPIARAVVDGARERSVDIPPSTGHAIEPGAGASAMIGGLVAAVGRAEHLPDDLNEQVDRLSAHGLTTFIVRRAGEAIGLVAVSDRVRPGAAETVGRLYDMGLDVTMVTGDRRTTAGAIASSVGIRNVLAEVYPEGKVDEVARIQSDGHRVVFVGDGINDAPALAQADMGIALGTGTDVAIEAADVTLLSGGIDGVADSLDLARRTYRVIAENLFWAFAYNVVMIPLAVFGVLTPMWAACAMAASSVSVVANALRLRRFRRSSRTLMSE